LKYQSFPQSDEAILKEGLADLQKLFEYALNPELEPSVTEQEEHNLRIRRNTQRFNDLPESVAKRVVQTIYYDFARTLYAQERKTLRLKELEQQAERLLHRLHKRIVG